MTFLLRQIFKFFAILHSDADTTPIAVGISLGLILGFAPGLSLQTLLVVLLLFIFRIQVGAALVAAIAFKFIAYLLDPVSNQIGMAVLETESLRPLFTELYNMPIIPLTRFYNSIVMGAGVLSIILALPTFFISKVVIAKYRETIVERFQHTKFWKLVKATKFYGLYAKFQG